jgi:hypothetical protein
MKLMDTISVGSMYQIKYYSNIFNWSDTGEKIGIQWNNISYTHGLHKTYDSIMKAVLCNIRKSLGYQWNHLGGLKCG